jgi:hypothetical protein
MAFKCSLANTLHHIRLEREINNLTLTKREEKFEVSGCFGKGVDLLHLTEELRFAAEADGNKTGETIVQLSSNSGLSYMLHAFSEKESVYMRESDGYFLLLGFTDVNKIITTIVEMQYFIEMQ